jgi:hypothetical protein
MSTAIDMDMDMDMDTDEGIDAVIYIGYEDYAMDGKRINPGYLFNRADGRYKVVSVGRHYDCHQPKGIDQVIDGLGAAHDTNMVKWEVKAVKK